MTVIPGVTVKKNARGKLTHVSIDLRQHQEAIPALKEMGLLPKVELDIDDTVTLEEFDKELESVINDHYGNTP